MPCPARYACLHKAWPDAGVPSHRGRWARLHRAGHPRPVDPGDRPVCGKRMMTRSGVFSLEEMHEAARGGGGGSAGRQGTSSAAAATHPIRCVDRPPSRGRAAASHRTRRRATASRRRARLRSRTRSPSPGCWTSSGSTMSRAAIRALTRPTPPSSQQRPRRRNRRLRYTGQRRVSPNDSGIAACCRRSRAVCFVAKS